MSLSSPRHFLQPIPNCSNASWSNVDSWRRAMTFDTRGGSRTISSIAGAPAAMIPAKLSARILWGVRRNRSGHGLEHAAVDKQSHDRTGRRGFDVMRLARGLFIGAKVRLRSPFANKLLIVPHKTNTLDTVHGDRPDRLEPCTSHLLRRRRPLLFLVFFPITRLSKHQCHHGGMDHTAQLPSSSPDRPFYNPWIPFTIQPAPQSVPISFSKMDALIRNFRQRYERILHHRENTVKVEVMPHLTQM